MRLAEEPAEKSQSSSRPRSGLFKFVVLATIVVVVPASLLASSATWHRFFGKKTIEFATVPVDRGDIELFVSENGSLESASNTKVLNKVEALIGTVGGAQPTQTKAATGSGTATAAGGTQASGTQTQATATAATADPATKTKSAAKSKTSSTRKSSIRKPGTVKNNPTTIVATAPASTSSGTQATSTASTTTSSSSSGGGGGGGGMSGGSGGGSSATTTAPATGTGAASNNPKPAIKSFTYVVQPYTSLRPVTKAVQTKAATPAPAQQGGGGGGGRGGNNQQQEKPGSTRIVEILPEGSLVKAGDVVCRLDSSAFDDELRSQRIKYAQAQAWVEQAKSMLEVNQIAYEEYQKGTLPLDLQVLASYRKTCRVATEQAKQTLDWSEDLFRKKLRTNAQFSADKDQYRQAILLEEEAALMEERLLKYTSHKILTAHQAKIEANRADLFAQQASFEIESDRLKRLEKNVANCTLKAPLEGIVVYANEANGWGRVDFLIQEGVTVREGQAIFNLPDPKRMRVKTRVSETKVSWVHEGQHARVLIDAFPDKPLEGTVTELTAIPAPSNGPISDVKVYYAMVNIDTPITFSLLPGLSAEVQFACDFRTDIVRVPLESIRWMSQQAFVAIPGSGDARGYRWQPIEVGLIGADHAEVVSGVEPGIRVIANPRDLPAPIALPAKRSTVKVASAAH